MKKIQFYSKFLWVILCLYAIKLTASANEFHGIQLGTAVKLPENYVIEVLDEDIPCSSIQEISMRNDGWFAVYFRHNVVKIGGFDAPDSVQYIGIYNKDGEQQYVLTFSNPTSMALEFVENNLYIYSPPVLVKFDVDNKEAVLYHIPSESDIEDIPQKWELRKREFTIGKEIYRCIGNTWLVCMQDSKVEVILVADHSKYLNIKIDEIESGFVIGCLIWFAILCFILVCKIKKYKHKKSSHKVVTYDIEEIDNEK